MSGAKHVQIEVWEYLTAKGSAPAACIAKAMQRTEDSIQHALRRGETAGYVERDGSRYNRLWKATAKKPIDNRGRVATSRAALRMTKDRTRVERKSRFNVELARCWGWWPSELTLSTLREMYSPGIVETKGAACAHSRQNDQVTEAAD